MPPPSIATASADALTTFSRDRAVNQDFDEFERRGMVRQVIEPSIAWDQMTLSGDSPWTGIALPSLDSSTVFAPSKTAWFVGYDEPSGYQSQQESKTQRSGRLTALSADLTAVRSNSANGIADVELIIRVAISSSKER
jgi:hypothetical protein